MQTINVAEAREKMTQLLKSVEHGEEVIIQRYQKPVARLVPYTEKTASFPDLSALRASQKPAQTTLADLRDEERY
jgi:prevent-host-death family protein